jgi:hypothetical protein
MNDLQSIFTERRDHQIFKDAKWIACRELVTTSQHFQAKMTVLLKSNLHYHRIDDIQKDPPLQTKPCHQVPYKLKMAKIHSSHVRPSRLPDQLTTNRNNYRAQARILPPIRYMAALPPGYLFGEYSRPPHLSASPKEIQESSRIYG